MTDNYYFPLNANIMEDPTVCQLIADKGMKGFGVYIGILIILRRTAEYKTKTSTINVMAMKLVAPAHLVKYLVYVSGLFVIEKIVKDEKTESYFYSPYPTEAMADLEAKRQKMSEAGKKGVAAKAEKNAQGGLSYPQAEEKRREENNSNNRVVAVGKIC